MAVLVEISEVDKGQWSEEESSLSQGEFSSLVSGDLFRRKVDLNRCTFIGTFSGGGLRPFGTLGDPLSLSVSSTLVGLQFKGLDVAVNLNGL